MSLLQQSLPNRWLKQWGHFFQNMLQVIYYTNSSCDDAKYAQAWKAQAQALATWNQARLEYCCEIQHMFKNLTWFKNTLSWRETITGRNST